VKPAPFDYVRPSALDEALGVLAADEEARPIAGGQSLLPLLNLRLARPTTLIDLRDLGLDRIDVGSGELRIGASVTHRRLELDPAIRAVPLLADAAAHVGSPAIRNRGTLGGSLAHADPAAELPSVAVAIGATIVLQSIAGQRLVSAGTFFDGFWTTAIEPGELLVEVRFPVAGARHGAAFCEVAPRADDFATAGVGVAVDVDERGSLVRVRAGGCGLASTPVDLGPALAPVVGRRVDDDVLHEVAASVEASVEPSDDRVATADERRMLAGLLAARALAQAADRASGPIATSAVSA